MRVLVVEDQRKLLTFIKKGLQQSGYSVDAAESVEATEALAFEFEYDLIILDVMLPDGNGFDITRRLRQHGLSMPILMLTALGETSSKIKGLDAGADDYLTKPFAIEELLARVRALLRRRQDLRGSSTLVVGDLQVDLRSRKVTRRNREIQLSAKEFALLEYLMRNQGRTLSRTQIMEHVWDMHFDSESNVIDVYINLLRKKVDLPFDQKLIKTVHGTGYMLKESSDEVHHA